MAGQYDAVATRALAVITKKGAPVTFDVSTGDTADPLSGTVSTGTPSSMASSAVQIPDDPETITALETQLGAVIANPVTLLVAAKPLASDPVFDQRFTWGALRGVVKSVETLRPAGTEGAAILHTVIGSLS